MVGYRGRLKFAQYMPQKPDKKGIKLWVMADRCRYLYNLQVYSGQEGDRSKHEREIDQSHRVVLDMTSVLNNNGVNNIAYNVTTDRLFTRMKTAEALLKKNITHLGTIRNDRLEVPYELRKKNRDGSRNRRMTGTTMYAYSDRYMLCSHCPKPNKLVHLLSTRHVMPNEIDNEDGVAMVC
ncbi:piggyBac transposable element-derived protein 4-like protein [Leptotrombidium deliense]|uniref:PiggyBac transposable element-derived protein 4-like protein n=1 Tax=Leptotrombidium deliense TaxID=299467 RepID=A0A443RUR0_9ACAR|nr:piggyBac transposable element-derived protein 4-like protein [Leptotrombidium deliense]